MTTPSQASIQQAEKLYLEHIIGKPFLKDDLVTAIATALDDVFIDGQESMRTDLLLKRVANVARQLSDDDLKAVQEYADYMLKHSK